MFKRSLINSAIVASLALAGQQAIAAEEVSTEAAQVDDKIEVIEVVGIRGSLSQAMNNKRFSTQIIDSIVAEDIGKFPDNNVVESLQRVTGVQVTGRGGGETSTISIRGLNDVHTSVNGRDLFTGAGRAVALQDIPASLLAGVDVFKTRSASQVERGIAGSIDIKTHRPFNFDDSKVVISGRAIYADQTEQIDPNLSILASDRWETDYGEVGALVNISYVETNYRDDSLTSGAAFPFFTSNPPSGYQPNKIMNFAPASNYWSPGLTDGLASAAGSTLDFDGEDVEYLLARDAIFGTVGEAKRERPAFNLSLQWAPTDDLELLAEAFYTGYRQELQNTLWFTNTFEEGPNGEKSANDGNLQIDTPLIYEGTNLVKARQVYSPSGFQSGDATTGETDSFLYALGATWNATNDLTIKSEVLYQTSQYDTEFFAMRWDRKAYGLDYDANYKNSGTPSVVFWDDPSTDVDESDLSETANWNTGTIYDNGGGNEGDAVTLTFDAEWMLDNDYIETVKFGGKAEKRGASSYTREDSYTTVLTVDEMIQSLADAGASNSNNFVQKVDNYMDGEAKIFDSFISANGLYMIANQDAVREIYGAEKKAIQTTFDIEETSYALYATALYNIGEYISGEVGVRYVDYSQDMEFWDLSGNYDTGEGGASEVLPSVVVNWNVTQDLVARFAYTETLRMPEFNSLNALQFWNDPLTEGINYGTGTGGNPDLEPTYSSNYDLSLEWYFAEGGTLYGAIFQRDIEGLVISGSKIVNRVGDDEVQRDYILSAPVNASDGELSGVEIGFLYFPADLPEILDGIGVQASYTTLDSSQTMLDYDDDGSVIQEIESKMSGVSDSSYSIVGIYEKENFDLRLSYFWREAFYVGDSAALFANPLQIWSRPEQSLDFRFNYDLTDNLSVSFDATNILDDVFQNYYGEGNDDLFNTGSATFSRSFALGVRYDF